MFFSKNKFCTIYIYIYLKQSYTPDRFKITQIFKKTINKGKSQLEN